MKILVKVNLEKYRLKSRREMDNSRSTEMLLKWSVRPRVRALLYP